MSERPTWEQYALAIAEAASTRSRDPRVKVGACILGPDRSTISSGYNGLPRGVEHQLHDDVVRRSLTIHAEINALSCTTRLHTRGGLLATTLFPCENCVKASAACGIAEIVYRDDSLSGSVDMGHVKAIADILGIRIRQLRTEGESQ